MKEKHFMKKLFLYLIFFCSINVSMFYAQNSGLAGCKIANNKVITVSQVLDTQENMIIQAVVGNVGSDPNTWVTNTISDGVSSTNNFSPLIILNTLGDVIVIWMYITPIGTCKIAASILLHGTSIWYSATLSDDATSACYADQRGVLDDSGNVLITWTAYNADTNNNSILGATTLLSTGTTWSAPFVIIE